VIKYRLHCLKGHEFEAWFSSSAAYDAQAQGQQVCCPECDGREVVKAVMAPNVALRGAPDSGGDAQGKVPTVVHLLREFRRALLADAEDVGRRFPEEARKIHYGETQARGIAGMASGEEARALIEEGIEILVLPPLPEEAN
jgi:hypothetical protein